MSVAVSTTTTVFGFTIGPSVRVRWLNPSLGTDPVEQDND
jgi:hypothetical protein